MQKFSRKHAPANSNHSMILILMLAAICSIFHSYHNLNCPLHISKLKSANLHWKEIFNLKEWPPSRPKLDFSSFEISFGHLVSSITEVQWQSVHLARPINTAHIDFKIMTPAFFGSFTFMLEKIFSKLRQGFYTFLHIFFKSIDLGMFILKLHDDTKSCGCALKNPAPAPRLVPASFGPVLKCLRLGMGWF